ncbi:MAG: CPBP family glutamic-type intramembrane protease [Infirmifilum sp.]
MFTRSLGEKASRLWLLVFLVYLAMLNINQIVNAYTLLLVFTAIAVIPGLREPPNLGCMEGFALFLLGLSGHLPLIRFFILNAPPIQAYVFSLLSAVIEELFFRGFLLPRLGLPVQALVFMYSHLNFTDPVFLINTALLAPHYFFLGIITGKIAAKWGFEGSSIFHASYNIVAISYSLGFDLKSVIWLLLSDLILLLILWLLFEFLLLKISV